MFVSSGLGFVFFFFFSLCSTCLNCSHQFHYQYQHTYIYTLFSLPHIFPFFYNFHLQIFLPFLYSFPFLLISLLLLPFVFPCFIFFSPSCFRLFSITFLFKKRNNNNNKFLTSNSFTNLFTHLLHFIYIQNCIHFNSVLVVFYLICFSYPTYNQPIN